MRSYNLFRSKAGDGLCCAVPETRAVPRFVSGEKWSFGGKLEPVGKHPIGFDQKAAALSVRFNGFYLFHARDARLG